jgi:hypothetical protein
MVYHVLNRGNGRLRVFHKPGDYQAFLDLLVLGKERANIELLNERFWRKSKCERQEKSHLD